MVLTAGDFDLKPRRPETKFVPSLRSVVRAQVRPEDRIDDCSISITPAGGRGAVDLACITPKCVRALAFFARAGEMLAAA